MKIKLIIIFLSISVTLFSLERIAVLPTISKKQFKVQALAFRKKLIEIINDNNQFVSIADRILGQNFRDFNLKEPNNSNPYLLRSALLSGAAKILYSEIDVTSEHTTIYIKGYDSQLSATFWVERFTVNNNLDVIIKRIYQRLKENYLSQEDYRRLVKRLRLIESDIINIESHGGSISGYNLLKNKKITIDEYVNIVLMAGSAFEFSHFIDIGYSSAYYIKYLSYVNNIPLF